MLDPVTWAAEALDWHCFDPDGEIWKRKNAEEYHKWRRDHPGEDILGKSRYHRPYQALLLRCRSKRKVARIGRQCLVGDTQIYLQNGEIKKIKDIIAGDKVLSLNIETNTIESDKVLDKWAAGKKDIYEIKTRFGKKIRCSANHKFLIIREEVDRYHGRPIEKLEPKWMSINSGLEAGYKIATPYVVQNKIQGHIGKLAILLGYFLSDGSSARFQSSKFTNNEEFYKKEFEEVCKYFGSNCKWYEKENGHDLIISNGRGKENPVRDILSGLGVINITGPQKFIPDCVMNASDEDVVLFLNRFWAGDGYISTFKRTGRKTFRTEIGTLQENLKMIKQLKLLFLRFGIHSYIKKEGEAYRLVVSNKFSVDNFLKYIGDIPVKEPQGSVAKKNLLTISDKYFHKTGDVLWDYISSISKVEEEETYDLETERNHNFLANEIFVHNSGKSEAIVISILFHLFTAPGVPEGEGFRVLILTPYQAQIDLLFNRMTELVYSNSETANSVASNTKSPPRRLELHNGSICTGFTAGSKSGGNADSVRGQKANFLAFDETDFLNIGDLESALSVITNYPDATVWMSSTPRGTRNTFYNTCFSRAYKEFHYPSSVNPLWSDELDRTLREQLTEIAFKHEALAEFGEQEEGVFQNIYVQKAKLSYRYGELTYDPSWVFTMGVDWNDVKIGTSIVVVGFNTSNNQFYLMGRWTVSREGWQQLTACQKVAELNKFWRPEAIYIDSGYGSTNREVLREYGYLSIADPEKGPNHPDSKLKDIVKGYEFGGKVDMYDPITKQPISKPAKPFLVENTVRRFETGTIHYSEHDEAMEKQLLNYIVDHVTTSGTPVYKATDAKIGDHDLDALMLALVAYTLEKSRFGKPIYSIDFSFAGRFGEKVIPDTEGAGIIIENKKKEDPRTQSKPKLGRASEMSSEKTSLTQTEMPAANLSSGMGETKIWAWPGFGSDQSRPTLGNKNSPSMRTSRPRRKNI